MVRRRRLIAQLALVGVLALLAFPGESSAFRPIFVISLTPAGPSPAALEVPAGLGQVWFSNTDTVTHTVVFANGLCSTEVAPGSRGQCTSGFMSYVGDYPYTVDGTSQAHLVIEAVGRGVSLGARSHSISRGSQLRLHGRLGEESSNWSPPSAGSPQPIIVLARPDRYHAFHRIAVVRAKVQPRTKNAPFGELIWQLRLRPRARTIYIAEANSQPSGGQVWQRAWSKPFRVRVGR
jgi:plastocyanin